MANQLSAGAGSPVATPPYTPHFQKWLRFMLPGLPESAVPFLSGDIFMRPRQHNTQVFISPFKVKTTSPSQFSTAVFLWRNRVPILPYY